jgi:hypothetical protein
MAGPSIFGIDISTVNWYYVIYVLFSIFLITGGISQLYPTGTPRAVIYGVGTTLVCIFYGYRWFASSKNDANMKWPPVINTCPDYLTYVPSMPGDSQYGCVDMLGVSSNGGLQKSLPSDIMKPSALKSTNTSKVIPYSSQDVTKAGSIEAVQAICAACSRAGVTWEGVWDGDVCTGIATMKRAQADASSNKCS